MKLDDALLILATDPNPEQMDHDTFIGKYEWHVRSYMSRTGPYETQIYDEEEAQKRHMQIFDFAGYTADIMVQELGSLPFQFKADLMVQELGGLPFKFKCVQYGLKHAPQAVYEEVMQVGKQQSPYRVALPEGIQDEPGGMPSCLWQAVETTTTPSLSCAQPDYPFRRGVWTAI